MNAGGTAVSERVHLREIVVIRKLPQRFIGEVNLMRRSAAGQPVCPNKPTKTKGEGAPGRLPSWNSVDISPATLVLFNKLALEFKS